MATATTTKHILVIIDSAIDDHQILAQGILPTAKVIVLNKYQDGIAQISNLSKNHPAASIQIIAHGSPGNLQLGNSQLNLANLHTYRQQLQQWQAAEILIYGCEVAATETGKTFIEQLHQLTGANIAASAQKIGNTQQGGTWELEVNIGRITSTLALKSEIREAYPGVFATFATATNFSVGIRPESVTVGDFNGDGKLDLAVANFGDNTVSVLLTGGFGTTTKISVGSKPYSVIEGDFNGDGNLDLATANYGSNTVSVLLGNGTGGFGSATDFTVGNNPYSVTEGDFNADGKLDLAAANFSDNTVSVLLGDGTGAFGTPTNFSVGNKPDSVTVGDFNGDGKLDLAATNYGDNTVSVLLSIGTGGFGTATNFSVGSKPYLVRVGDFNSDGKLDLAATNYGDNTVSVLLGTGTGGFGTATNFSVGTGPSSVAVGDFNGDGKLDLAATNYGDNTVSVLLNVTSATLTIAEPTRLTNPNDDVFNITGQDVKTTLEVKLTGHNSPLVNELGLFTVDDPQGTINGIAPAAEGYAQAAILRSQVILSAIANNPNGFDTNNLTRLLQLNSGQNFRFLLVQDGTLDAVRNDPNSIGKLLFSSVSTQKITDLGDNSFSLGWKDASGKSSTDFNDLVVKINQTDQALPLGTNLQGEFQGELIDLRDVQQSVEAQFNVYREASYNNYVGFYQVTDENGGIDTNGDGIADVLTGQAGYIQAAVRGRVAGIDLSVSNQGSATYNSVTAVDTSVFSVAACRC
ncbi:MAG: FG-GAP-like repeat-containing protein [Nostoc sp.]